MKSVPTKTMLLTEQKFYVRKKFAIYYSDHFI